MGWNAPGQDLLDQYRNKAQEEHNAYWAQNNYEVKDNTFFPGYEAGWHDAVEKLSKGESLPDDLEAYAKSKADDPENWEWVHGYKAGMEGAQKAGEQ